MTSFEEAYDLTGHGKFNHLALLTCGCILLYVTTECLGLGFVLSKAECDLDISVTERGLIAASTLIGVVTPAIFWGYLADGYGRRRVMLPSLLVTILTSSLSSLAVNFWNMLLLRVLTGLLISASCATVYVYLGELHTTAHRASAIAWGSAFIALSYFSMPGMAWAIMTGSWSIDVSGNLFLVPWRAYMWAWGLWGSLAAVGLYILPESPRYLLATKGPEAVLPILAKIYAWNHNTQPADYPVRAIASTLHEAPRLTFTDSILRMRWMIRPPLLRCVLISHFCNFLVFLQSNAFYVWMPHIVNELLHNPKSSDTMCELMNTKYNKEPVIQMRKTDCEEQLIDSLVYPISMTIGVMTAVMYVTIGFVVEKFGKKKVFCIIMLTCSALTMASGLVSHSYLAIALLVPGMCGITANTVLATVAVDVFPTSLRALALCTLFMVGRLGAALGTHLIALAMQNNCTAIVVAITMLTGGSSLLMALWPDAKEVRAKMEAESFVY